MTRVTIEQYKGKTKHFGKFQICFSFGIGTEFCAYYETKENAELAQKIILDSAYLNRALEDWKKSSERKDKWYGDRFRDIFYGLLDACPGRIV